MCGLLVTTPLKYIALLKYADVLKPIKDKDCEQGGDTIYLK